MPQNTHILDPYMGSGSTLIAAQKEGIRADGIELNPDYIQIAKARLFMPLDEENELEEDTFESRQLRLFGT